MRVLRVALDVPVAKLFDYLTDDATPAGPGDRVAVPFGARERVGVVVEVADASAVAASRLKPVTRVLADAPTLSADWLEQMRFLSSYYQRPLGETVAGALPPRRRSLKPLPKRKKTADAPAGGAAHRFVTQHEPNPAQAQAIGDGEIGPAEIAEQMQGRQVGAVLLAGLGDGAHAIPLG